MTCNAATSRKAQYTMHTCRPFATRRACAACGRGRMLQSFHDAWRVCALLKDAIAERRLIVSFRTVWRGLKRRCFVAWRIFVSLYDDIMSMCSSIYIALASTCACVAVLARCCCLQSAKISCHVVLDHGFAIADAKCCGSRIFLNENPFLLSPYIAILQNNPSCLF